LNRLRNTREVQQNSHKLIKQRKRLQVEVDSFLANVPFVLDTGLPATSTFTVPNGDVDDDTVNIDEESESSESEEDSDGDTPQLGSNPEKALLPLPSHLGPGHFHNPLIAALADEEVHLRIDQASEALQQLRLSLGLKSALFKHSVAPAKSQRTKTRAWRTLNSVDASVRRHAQEYRNARQALVHLRASGSVMDKFPILKKEDLKMSRDVVEENRVGQRSEHVSWIWRLDHESMIGKNAWLQESECLCWRSDNFLNSPGCMSVQRVNWLRAKARHQRWKEEITIVEHEMVWTQLWFKHQIQVWEEREEVARLNLSHGHKVYAAKQVWVWKNFLDDAKTSFMDVLPTTIL
jgi:hypothetical protein